MLLLRISLVLFLTLAVWPASPAVAYEITAAGPGPQELSAAQFKDFANEWAFVSSPPILGPTRPAETWRPWVHLSHNIRSVRLAPGSGERDLSHSEYAWIANPRFSSDPDASILLPTIQAGLALPGKAHVGLFYGRSPNVNLQVAGIDASYPFLTPSLDSPGLWARLIYAYPSRMPGLTLHVLGAGLYLTNEFLRTPVRGLPLTLHLHAGLQQPLVFALPQDLVEKLPGEETGTTRDLARGTVTFPASTQFEIGLEVVRDRWSFAADAGYASGESTIGGEKRIRAFWNQAYRLAYRWN